MSGLVLWGGLNFKRQKFIAMIIEMLKGNTSIIVVAHKDRLARFAFNFEELANSVGCKIIVARSRIS